MADNDFFSEDIDFETGGNPWQDDEHVTFTGSPDALRRAAESIGAEHHEFLEEAMLDGANRVVTCDLRGRTAVFALPSILRAPLVRFEMYRARKERGVKSNVDRTVVLEGG